MLKRQYAKLRYSPSGWVITLLGEDWKTVGNDQLAAQEEADGINDACVGLSQDDVRKKYLTKAA
ncbi:hypothetical protein [Derxia gummosa]|uniref:Uncharacterized protein n=1 Tax=Derxia gummosa DSM 723 TaxID=1121388 RepID=A0A8B6X6V0_9BURK|nr:hypothetical protein [Derxia gummosa]